MRARRAFLPPIFGPMALLAFAACGDPSVLPRDAGADGQAEDAGPFDGGGLDASLADSAVPDGDVADAAPDAAMAPRIEIGTGIVDFVEVPRGGDVELVMGLQGGWHVEIAFRLYGLDPESLRLMIRGTRAGTEEEVIVPIDRTLTARRVEERDGYLLRTGELGIFTIEAAEEVIGADVLISVAATPPTGEDPFVVHAENVFHIVDLVDELGD